MAARPKRITRAGQSSLRPSDEVDPLPWAAELSVVLWAGGTTKLLRAGGTPPLLSAGAKSIWLSLTSGGNTSIPIARASTMYWLSLAVSAMSLVLMAQKNSTGQFALRYAV